MFTSIYNQMNNSALFPVHTTCKLYQHCTTQRCLTVQFMIVLNTSRDSSAILGLFRTHSHFLGLFRPNFFHFHFLGLFRNFRTRENPDIKCVLEMVTCPCYGLQVSIYWKLSSFPSIDYRWMCIRHNYLFLLVNI